MAHKCGKETEIALIKQNNVQLVGKINEIHKAIVGNGKPGLLKDVHELKLIQKNHDETLKAHSKILDKLTLRLAYYAGAIAVITLGASIAVRALGL